MNFMKMPIVEQDVDRVGQVMDPNIIHSKVELFAQQLLSEAQGDPIRALGLLALVLDGPEIESPVHAWRLLVKVRNILMPDSVEKSPMPIRHLVGTASWEGIQHCLRCGKVLRRDCQEPEGPLPQGYAFEIGARLTVGPCDDYRVCS